MGRCDWSLSGAGVVVAGAGGFIGARITRCLADAGCEVHALVRPGGNLSRLDGVSCHVLEANALEPESLRSRLGRIHPAVVVNAIRAPRQAGAEDPLTLIAGNVTAAAHLMLGAHRAGCRRFLQIGSSTEYAPTAGPISESRPLLPVTTHGSTKAAASLVCRSMARDLAIQLAVVRPFQVYGPGDWPGHLIPRAIRASLEERELRLAPSGRRDWVFVDDVAEACHYVLAADHGDLELNVGTGRQWTNAEVVQRVEAATSRAVAVAVEAAAGREWDRNDWVADISRARALLGWQPRHDLDAGLAKTVAWEQQRRAAAEVTVR